jgi:hypothetical protein
MATRDYDSYIFRKGVSPNTLSVISSKNRIFSVNAVGDLKQIGVIATFDPSEARTIEPIRGIGFGDHIAELVPGVTDPMTISVTRSALYVSNIYQIFGYKSGIDGLVRSLRHHRWPFDIRQEVVFSRLAYENTGVKENLSDITVLGSEDNPDGNVQALVTIYEACWISDYSISYASDTALVQETVTINVSDILSQEPYSSYLDVASYDQLASDQNGISQRLRS